jgi:hypothetical protein
MRGTLLPHMPSRREVEQLQLRCQAISPDKINSMQLGCLLKHSNLFWNIGHRPVYHVIQKSCYYKMIQTAFIVLWNLDSSVGTAIHYGLNGSGFRIPAGVRGFLSSITVQNDSRVHLFNLYRGPFPRTKRPGSEVDHTYAPSAEVKNEWNYSFTPPIYSFMACIDTTLPSSFLRYIDHSHRFRNKNLCLSVFLTN